MRTKFIRLAAAFIVMLSIFGNTGVARADSGVPRLTKPQPLDIQAFTIPPASSLGVQFVHIATAANIYASYTTIIDNPLTNGNPNAIILVTPNDNPGNVGGINDPHPIGVIYSNGKWAIYNQDIAAMPIGAAFNVIIPTAGAGVFVQNTTVAGTSTDIDSVLTDSHPNAIVLVTPNYNPGGACGCVSANFHIGVEYSSNKWRIFTQDGSLMPLNGAFNVFILPAGKGVFVQKATTGNTANVYSTYIDNALTNGNPNAIVQVTQNYNPGGVLTGTGDDHPIGVFYNGSKWEIYNQDLSAMQVDVSFNVLVLVPSSAFFVQKSTAGNTQNSTTMIDNALTNAHDNVIVFITPNLTPGGVTGVYNNHNTGVSRSGAASVIFNQDLAAMPLNAAFNVLVPNPDTSVFVHTASAANINSHTTTIDYPLTNGNPNAIILVTPNFAAGGTCGCIHDDHPIGVNYDGTQWRIFNQDGAAMPVGAAFNVFVPTASVNVFVHTATSGNTFNPDATQIDNALTNGHPNAMLIVTSNWNPGGVGGTNNSHPIGVYFDGARWEIFNEDGGSIPVGAAFNVYVFSPPTTYRSVGAADGWILESAKNSTQGGTLDATATTFNLGDNAQNKQYRTILSFNTSSLPDTAVITKVTLKIRKQGQVGTNPFTVLGGLKVDMRKPFFGTTGGLVISDFQAAAGKTAAAIFGVTPSSGWYSGVLNGAGRAYINLTGTTQFRLGFAMGDNNNNVADYMKFFSGDAGAALRPQLIIEYYIP
jgi:hypothetical protein